MSEMERSETEERRDAETLAGLATAPSTSAGGTDRPSSSGFKRKTKTRKPYTITKQREKWTDQEHARFLDALRMYGRAWRRIEEHIGSKTAVQIRSHAQKFFSKLEKQEMSGAKGEGVPEGIINIPPPRPKRKPSHPYPRKPFSGSYDGATAEGAGSQDHLSAQARLPDYSHLAPKLKGNERLDVAVAAVTQAASSAAAAAAAAVISAAGEQIRAHMQACPPQCFPFYGLAPSMLAQLSLQQLSPQGGLQASKSAMLPQFSGLNAAAQAGQPGGWLSAFSKLQRSEFSGTSADPLSAPVPVRAAERRTNVDGSDGNRHVLHHVTNKLVDSVNESACSREDPTAEDGRLPGDTGATSRQGMGINRLGTWPSGPGLQQSTLQQQQWSPEMLSELYYNWNNMTSLSAAAAAAAADTGGSANAAATANDGNWRAVVQAAAAAASHWEVQKLNGLFSRDSGTGQMPGCVAQAVGNNKTAAAQNIASRSAVHNLEAKARRQGLSGSDGSGTNAADDRVEAMDANVGNPDAPDEESPSRDFDDSLYEPLGNKGAMGSLETNNSDLETGMKGEGELAYQVDAEGEGSGSNPTGNGESGNNSNGNSGGEGMRGSKKGSNSGSGNETDPCDKDGIGTSKEPAATAPPQSVRESIAGNDAAGSGGTDGSGSGNATRVSNGATVPTGLSKREGSDEGCTSLEHPQPRTHGVAKDTAGPAAAAAAFLAQQPAAAAAAAAANDFSALTGAQGLMDTAQMAQAATALQQTGLAPYLLQQQYNAQLAQLQQAAMMNWGGQKMSAFDMFNSLMGFQALAGQQAGHLQSPPLSTRPSAMPTNSGGAGELMSAPSGMASYDTMPHAPGRAPWAADTAAGLAEGASLPTAASGVLPRPKPAGLALPNAAAGTDSVSVSGQTQQSQGFMPYKWRHHPLPRGVHQLQPGGLLSLGKRSASASLAEPPRKRMLGGNLP